MVDCCREKAWAYHKVWCKENVAKTKAKLLLFDYPVRNIFFVTRYMLLFCESVKYCRYI